MANPLSFNRIAIFGPGLLGGSLAMALQTRFPESRIRVWGRRAEAVAEVSSRGLAEVASSSIAEVAEGAELAILCVPVEGMVGLARELAGHLSPEAIVTDVGSVKGVVIGEVAPVIRRKARFVGSHPMAGSEQEGLAAARPDLFEGAICLVTPDPASVEADVEAVARFWEAVGGRVCRMTGREHDAQVAWISHLPHLLAASLVNVVRENAPAAAEICGNGFRDSTRVAAGPERMWTEIFRHNRAALRESTEAMIEKLHEFAKMLDGFDEAGVREQLSTARAFRDRLKKN